MTLIVILAPVVGIYLFSLGVGVAGDRWSQSAGIESRPRVAAVRLAAGLACIILVPGLAAALATIHLALLALTVPVAVAGLVVGIRIISRGEEPPPRPARPDAGERYTGVSYFVRCWIPLRVHDYTRPALAALLLPVVAIVLLALGRTYAAALPAVVAVVAWILLVRITPRSRPRSGPCAPAE